MSSGGRWLSGSARSASSKARRASSSSPGRSLLPTLGEQPIDLAAAQRQVARAREDPGGVAQIGELGGREGSAGAGGGAQPDAHLRGDRQIESQPERGVRALEPLGGGARRARRDAGPDLLLGERALEHRLQLGGVAEQEPGLPGPHDLAVGLEVGADRQHAVRRVLDEPHVVAAAVVGRRLERRDPDVDLVEKALRPLVGPGGDEREARRRQAAPATGLQLRIAHDGHPHLRVALEHAGQRRNAPAAGRRARRCVPTQPITTRSPARCRRIAGASHSWLGSIARRGLSPANWASSAAVVSCRQSAWRASWGGRLRDGQIGPSDRGLRGFVGGGAREDVAADLVDGEAAVAATGRDDRQQVRVGDVADHQDVRGQEQAPLGPAGRLRTEQRGRQDRSADHRHVGHLAERAAGLDGAIDRRAAIERLGRADLRRSAAGGRGAGTEKGARSRAPILDVEAALRGAVALGDRGREARLLGAEVVGEQRGHDRTTPPPRRRPCGGPARRRTRRRSGSDWSGSISSALRDDGGARAGEGGDARQLLGAGAGRRLDQQLVGRLAAVEDARR